MAAETALLHNYLMVGALLFGIGLVGFLSRRNLILMFLCIEMMLQGVSLSLVAWGRYHNDFGGQMLVIFMVAVAACEAAVALALILALFARSGNLDINRWHTLREASLPEYVDQEIPELPAEPPPDWPHLPTAGIAPDITPEQTQYRSHV